MKTAEKIVRRHFIANGLKAEIQDNSRSYTACLNAVNEALGIREDSNPIEEKRLEFCKYTGGAGPTLEQQDNNTLVLHQSLKELGIEGTIDTDYAYDNWDTDEKVLQITHPVTGKNIYINYDRFGFASEEPDLDQVDLDQAVKKIEIWYKNLV